MATFVNPEILRRIFGDAPIAQPGAFDPSTSQGQQMTNFLASAGAGMTQAASQPGASFAQALGGGAQGMMQGQQQFLQQQALREQMEQMRAKRKRETERAKMVQDLIFGGQPDFTSEVAAVPSAQQMALTGTQVTPTQQGGMAAQSLPSGVNRQAWEAIFPDLMDRTIQQESGGRQFDREGRPLESSAGAIGVAQVMPGTAPEAAELAGLPWDEDRYRNDPEYNRALGEAYMGHMGATFGGDPVLASAAYNAGPGRVQQWIQEIGDPRRGEISHEEFIRQIPIDETRNYAAQVGLPGVQQMQSPGQARMVQQPQQAPQSGFPQQQQGSRGALAGLTPQQQAILGAMDPDDALSVIGQRAFAQPSEQPADVRTAMFMAGGDEELARRIMLNEQNQTELSDFQKRIATVMQANPGTSFGDAANFVLGVTGMDVSPNTGRVTRTNELQGQASEVPVRPGEELPERQSQGPTGWDVAQGISTTGVAPGLGELANRTLGQIGMDVQEDRVTARQFMTQLRNDVVRAFQESPRFAEGERQQILEELELGPSILRSESTLRAGLRSSASSLAARLDRYRRMAADPQLGETTRRDAAEKATIIQDAIRRLGVPEDQLMSRGEFAPGGDAGAGGDIDALVDRWAD